MQDLGAQKMPGLGVDTWLLGPFLSDSFPCPRLRPGHPESLPELCSVRSLLHTPQEKPVWVKARLCQLKASRGTVPGGAGGCFACSWSEPAEASAPQTLSDTELACPQLPALW